MGEELTGEDVVAGIENAISKGYDDIEVNQVFDATNEFTDNAVDAGIAGST